MTFPKLFACLAAAFGCIPIAAQCGTSVAGAVNSTTWTTAGSPYCVSGTVAVANLTINPGVEVRLAPNARLQVSTWMRAIGTRAQPIVFRADNLTAGRWGSIVFQGPVPPTFRSNLEWCRIEGAGDSGVTILENDNVVIRNCRIVSNQSAGVGGGIRVELAAGTLTIQDCDVVSNSATSGAGFSAIIGTSGELTLRGCRISQNRILAPATLSGGGILMSGEGRAILLGCLIQRNTLFRSASCGQQLFGGGAAFSNASVEIANCAFLSNSMGEPQCTNSRNYGGGVNFASTVRSAIIRNTIVACNDLIAQGSQSQGSGIRMEAASSTLTNTTIARNGAGGGLYVAGGTCTVRNSILFSNTGSQITGPGTVTIDYSNVQGGVTGGTGNFNFSPAFAGSGCDPEDFGLLDFSPSVDAGDPDPAYNDGCRPPARGTARNDMGVQGGPGACDFLAPVRIQCAVATYGEIIGGANTLLLDWAQLLGPPSYLGELRASRATPNGIGALLVGTRTGSTVFGDLTVLLDTTQPIGTQAITFDASGGIRLPVPLDLAPLAGRHIAVQVIDFDTNGARASNGLRISPCY